MKLTLVVAPFPTAAKALLSVLIVLATAPHVAGQGSEVVVVYNSRLPESKEVADYYAKRRSVPANQVLGLDLPTSEAITRQEFIERLRQPLARHLAEQKLFLYGPATNRLPDFAQAYADVTNSPVRYAVLCYGVPVKILRDAKLIETRAEKLPVELSRNEAAVDTQLACLPDWADVFPWVGPTANPYYGATNPAALHPRSGLLMVTRLDGPSAAIARGLVDKSIEAETNGLWGRAYIDSRGITNGNYQLGDDWMRGAAVAVMRAGFETVLDQKPETFPAGFPMSHVALYVGWYDQKASGPFTGSTVEFMPGAFAYHLYSFSAQTIRASNQSWTSVLLQKGATCTMGMVDEPYLQFTPNIAMFTEALLMGYSFGEAAYVSQTALSWQTTIIGDPLYRPVGQSRESLAVELRLRGGPLAEWGHLETANRRLLSGAPSEVVLKALESALEPVPPPRRSAVLTEKLGDLYWAQGRMTDAIDSYEGALRRSPSPAQRLRLLLLVAEKRAFSGPDDKAVAWYETLLKDYPEYPEPLRLHQQALPLARRLGRTNLVEQIEREIQRLSPVPTNAVKRP